MSGGSYHSCKLQYSQAAVYILLTMEICCRLGVLGIGSSEKDSRSLVRKPGHMNRSAWPARVVSRFFSPSIT
jgi:hypothetical protein